MRWAAGLMAGVGLGFAAAAALAAPFQAPGGGGGPYAGPPPAYGAPAQGAPGGQPYGGPPSYPAPPAPQGAPPYGGAQPNQSYQGPPPAPQSAAPHGDGQGAYGYGGGPDAQASQAYAGPPPAAPPPAPQAPAYAYSSGFTERIWPKADGGWYIYGHRAPPCAAACCACAGEVSLNDGFFADAGGVGPIPIDGGYGGGYFLANAGNPAFGRLSARNLGRPFFRPAAPVRRFHGGRMGH